jgi:hypothetical protein
VSVPGNRPSGTSSNRPSLIESLTRSAELLSADILRSLEELAQRSTLTDAELIKQVGEAGLMLITFGAAATQDPSIVENAPPIIEEQARDLTARLQSLAPTLLRQPRIESMARVFAEQLVGRTEPFKPYDDLTSVRAILTYLNASSVLVPAVRTEFLFANRKPIGPMSLRLVDVAFLISALTGNLAEALESVSRVSEGGMLDKDELDGLDEAVERLSSEVNNVAALLKRPQLNYEKPRND